MMCTHTPADNCVATYLQELFDKETPETVGDVLKVHALDPTVRADSLFLGASAMQADGVEIA